MDTKGKKIILGSNSPRRRELLKGLDIEFIVDPKTDFIESFSSDPPYEKVPALILKANPKDFTEN